MNLKKTSVIIFISSVFLFFSCTNQSRVKEEMKIDDKYNSSTQRAPSASESIPETPAQNEESIDYSKYHVMSFYPEETIDELYDAISYVVYIDDFNGHPLMIKDGENYYEVTGVGYSPSNFYFNGDMYKDRFYAQTVNGVYFIGVGLINPTTYTYSLSTISPYGVTFIDVYNLYRY